jgi:hypothetical protein
MRAAARASISALGREPTGFGRHFWGMTTPSRASGSQPPRAELHDLRIALPGQAPVRDVLYMPFQAGRHPETDAVGVEHLAWLREMGLLDARNARAFERARFHDLAGRIHHEDERDVVRLVADFIGALFVLDDVMDRGDDPTCKNPLAARAGIERIRRAAHAGVAPLARHDVIDAVAAALADLTRRLQQRGAPLAGYLHELDLSLDAMVEESRRRTVGFRSVDDYAQVRTAFSAVYPCIELGVAAIGSALTTGLTPLARLVNMSVSFVNDVYSWPKERAVGERSNLVSVLMHQHAFPETTSIHAACRACDSVVYDYLAARAEADGQDPRVLRLFDGWMRANLDWHVEGTDRYREHLSVATGRAEDDAARANGTDA